MQNCPHCGKSLVPEGLSAEFVYTVNRWFDAFWQLYPRHVGKANALKAWKKAATCEAMKDEIVAGLRAQLPLFAKRDKEHIPHASTWLNGLRWRDEITEVAGKGQYVQRVIACELCGDSGLKLVPEQIIRGLRVDAHLERCSCPRGQLPGLVIPKAEEIERSSFPGDPTGY